MSLPKQANCSECDAYGPVTWRMTSAGMVALCKRHNLKPVARRTR